MSKITKLFLSTFIFFLINTSLSATAQEFQTPTDLVLNHGNPFDDPNFRNEFEAPEGICAPSFVLVQGSLNSSPVCGPFDFYQDPKGHYIGCYQSLQLSGDYANKLLVEVESLKARLLQCKKSRGRRC